MNDVVPDGLQQVGFAEAHAAVDEQGVVGAGRRFRHGHRGCVRKAVARADDKRIERVLGAQRESVRSAHGRRRGGCGRAVFHHGQLNRDGARQYFLQRAVDQTGMSRLDPLFGVAAGHGKHKGVPADRERRHVLEVQLVCRFAQSALDAAERFLPDADRR